MSRSDCGIFLHISTIFPIINKCENLFSTNHQITFLIKREDVFTDDLPSQKNWNIVSCNTIWDPHTQQQKLQIEQIQGEQPAKSVTGTTIQAL